MLPIMYTKVVLCSILVAQNGRKHRDLPFSRVSNLHRYSDREISVYG